MLLIVVIKEFLGKKLSNNIGKFIVNNNVIFLSLKSIVW